MADGDWDFLMRLSVEDDAKVDPGKVLTPGLRDRLLSAEKQHRIAEALADAGRLTYQRGCKLPLITLSKAIPCAWARAITCSTSAAK
ncbi:MAG: hypothetical protein JWN27_3286 [Candidatus Eremiobacteraeota bacterium]|nr:hypothetical protein [Candidatus Eremiobacteraeota bacterium]